ncbi:hypothetical protein [Halosegnis marinus]|uniref:hypothetical protein n=1 Tax=Halosegnis marinus TaxID=3034023 RepID=UPI003616A26B
MAEHRTRLAVVVALDGEEAVARDERRLHDHHAVGGDLGVGGDVVDVGRRRQGTAASATAAARRTAAAWTVRIVR